MVIKLHADICCKLHWNNLYFTRLFASICCERNDIAYCDLLLYLLKVLFWILLLAYSCSDRNVNCFCCILLYTTICLIVVKGSRPYSATPRIKCKYTISKFSYKDLYYEAIKQTELMRGDARTHKLHGMGGNTILFWRRCASLFRALSNNRVYACA